MENKLVQNRKRLSVLNDRYEKILELNKINRYVSTLSSERKTNQYYSLLSEIKKQQYTIWNENRKLNKKYSASIERAKQNASLYLKSITLTKSDLFNLTSPKL